MRNVITARKVNLKDNFKERVDKKLSKFDRVFGEDTVANVTVTVEKNRQTVEVTIKKGGMVYRAENTCEEMNEALDNVVDVLGRQIRKNKSRLEKRLKSPKFSEYMALYAEDHNNEDAEEYKIIKTKHFPVKPLDAEEAILQMNLLGHQFYMFRNSANESVAVVYRRDDGGYGLIEPENED